MQEIWMRVNFPLTFKRMIFDLITKYEPKWNCDQVERKIEANLGMRSVFCMTQIVTGQDFMNPEYLKQRCLFQVPS